MRSFGLFTAAVAIASSIFASAAPLDITADVSAVVDVIAREPVDLGISEVKARAEVQPLVEILADLKANIGPIAAELSAIVAVNATVDVVTPLLAQIVAQVNAALPDIQALVDADINVILGSGDGISIVAVADIAVMLGDILSLVLSAVGNILLFLQVDVLGTVLVNVGISLGSLCGGCFGLLEGLLSLVLPLIVNVVADINLAGFVSLAAILNISLGISL